MLEIERLLTERLGWTLFAIDQTDIESLLPFIFSFNDKRISDQKTILVPGDQVDWA